jgi:hypothetical protein
MAKGTFKPTISDQTAKELEWFLKERELMRELNDEDMLLDLANDPILHVQQDVIAHLEELRDEMNKKIDLMKMRTKKIY